MLSRQKIKQHTSGLHDGAELYPINKVVLRIPAARVLTGCAPSTFGPGMMGFRPPSRTQRHPTSRPLMIMIPRFMASLR